MGTRRIVDWIAADPQTIWAHLSNLGWPPSPAITATTVDRRVRIDSVEAHGSIIGMTAKPGMSGLPRSILFSPRKADTESPPRLPLPPHARAFCGRFLRQQRDWLGSNVEVFGYRAPGAALNAYFDTRVVKSSANAY